MRRLLPLFLVLLLVLRGLLGDAMAMGTMPPMGAPVGSTAHSAAEHSHGSAADPASPHGSAHATADTAPHHPSDDHSEHSEHSASLTPADLCAAADASVACGDHSHSAPCAACVVCHSAVSPTTLQLAAGDTPPHVPPVDRCARFVSAQPLQASKPPIS